MSDAAETLFTRRSLLSTAALVLAFVAILWIESRPWWCKYGLGVWAQAWTHCTSQHVLDPYSLTHVLHGIIFYWLLWPLAPRFALRWRLIAALALEMGWEVLENSPWVIERYRQVTASLDYTGDSMINALGDVLMAALGFAFAWKVSWKVAIAVFIAIELGLLIFVRDNLTLNVLMLFFPLDAVKEWQLPG